MASIATAIVSALVYAGATIGPVAEKRDAIRDRWIEFDQAISEDIPQAFRRAANERSALSARVDNHAASLMLLEPEMDAVQAGQDRIRVQLVQMAEKAADDRASLATRRQFDELSEKLGDTKVDIRMMRYAAEQNAEAIARIADSLDDMRVRLEQQRQSEADDVTDLVRAPQDGS